MWNTETLAEQPTTPPRYKGVQTAEFWWWGCPWSSKEAPLLPLGWPVFLILTCISCYSHLYFPDSRTVRNKLLWFISHHLWYSVVTAWTKTLLPVNTKVNFREKLFLVCILVLDPIVQLVLYYHFKISNSWNAAPGPQEKTSPAETWGTALSAL